MVEYLKLNKKLLRVLDSVLLKTLLDIKFLFCEYIVFLDGLVYAFIMLYQDTIFYDFGVGYKLTQSEEKYKRFP